MFSALDLALWATQLVLELAGALYYSRRHKSIAVFLSFRAAADLLGISCYFFSGMCALQWSDYIQRMVQYPIMAWMAIECIGYAIGAKRKDVKAYCLAFSFLLAVGLVAVHGALAWNLSAVLWIEEKTVFGIALFLLAGLALRECEFEFMAEPMPKNAKIIAAGLLILLGSDGILTTARAKHWISWNDASLLIQAGSILALLLWWAGPQISSLKWKMRARVSAHHEDYVTLD